MTVLPGSAATLAEIEAEAAAGSGGGPLHGGPLDRARPAGRLVFAIAVAFSAFQIWTAAYATLSSLVVRSIHVGFLLLMTFAVCALLRQGRTLRFWSDWAVGGIAFLLGLYHWIFEVEIILRAGKPQPVDIAAGVAVLILVFEAARRLLGPALPIICGVFLAYALLGQYLPRPLNHRGYGFGQVIDHMFLGTEGIYGIPTFVSSTYIFLFILFGSFLERAGMIGLFNDVALGTVGHTRGGPAKVSVISSALMGTINGSGIANVVTMGQFTITLMKRFGFKATFAGAVEATSSMGGQIMPPVMGAVAFIMAETLNIPYAEVAIAAAVPAVLYFATVYWIVHLEAGRLGLFGIPRDQLPSAARALREKWHLILPLAVLVYLLFAGYTPLFAGAMGLALTAVLILGAGVAGGLPVLALRVIFWVVIGIAAASFFEYGVTPALLLIAALVAANFARRGGKGTLHLCLEGMAEGARNAVSVGIACALVGTIIGVMTLTGLASTFARVVVGVGDDSLFLSLLLTMVACLILGMGIPTIPNYIITSSLVGPALLELGVPLLVSHMFVFYFGIMADLTPPVALAAFAAAPLAQASGLHIGLQCVRIAIAGWVIPLMAVYAPALMMQGGDLVATAYVTSKALLAMILWGIAAIGYLFGPVRLYERAWALAAGVLLVVSLPDTDTVGFLLAAGFLAAQWWRAREVRRATA